MENQSESPDSKERTHGVYPHFKTMYRGAEKQMKNNPEKYQLVERSITKKFRNEIWNKFIRAVKEYELIQSGDKIAVCISGGKDSMLMAKLMQMLQRYSDIPFDLIYLVMDPGYNEINRQKIESNAALLHIPIQIFETNTFVQKCAEVIFIIRLKNWDVIRLLLVTTSLMSSKQL